ncbi:undecaprenyl-phosphate glucose phosphotransferase [Noviherbaspirillum pedocola]|nr:undecaprenyl-phosphate glucose phosphotransferase [Noviherbaspirillum pedocola]
MSNHENPLFLNLKFWMLLMDAAALWLVGELSSYLRFEHGLADAAPINSMLLYFCVAAALFMFPSLEMYQSWRGRQASGMYFHVAFSFALLLACGLITTFLIHRAGELSRVWVATWYGNGVLALIANRKLAEMVSRYLQRHRRNLRRVVIVGYGSTGRDMHERALGGFGYEITAIYPGEHAADTPIAPGIQRLESLESIQQHVLESRVHEVWITLPVSEYGLLSELHHTLCDALIDIRWVPDAVSISFLSNRMINFLGMPTLDLNQPASANMQGMLKEVFDRAFSLMTLLLLSPLLIAIAIGIKLTSPGPVLFTQYRLGKNGKPFRVYKFRSMHVHNEGGAVTQARRDDPRVTRLGAFLRRTSLDELPQFINVLKGDMSVVGPRPHAMQHNDFYRSQLGMYMVRHRVKPGITGWAQINGCRGETETVEKMARRVQFDIHYIQHWSFLMDIKIILWTAWKGWTGNNAY